MNRIILHLSVLVIIQPSNEPFQRVLTLFLSNFVEIPIELYSSIYFRILFPHSFYRKRSIIPVKAKNKSTSKPRCSKNQDRWQYSGSAVDQGNSGRSCSRVGSLPSLGSSCKRNRRYPKGSSLLRLAVSITLKHWALASAPLAVSQNKKFLPAITIDLTDRSATLFVSSSLPSSRTASNVFSGVASMFVPFADSNLFQKKTGKEVPIGIHNGFHFSHTMFLTFVR